MKIKVEVRLVQMESYSTVDVASAELAVEHIGDFNASAIARTLDDAVDDVTGRFNEQLRAIQKTKDREARERDRKAREEEYGEVPL